MQLGLGSHGASTGGTQYGTGAIRLHNISCKGTEASWTACPGAVWKTAPCNQQGHATLLCFYCQPTMCGGVKREGSSGMLALCYALIC